MTRRLVCESGRRIGKRACIARRPPGARMKVQTELAALRMYVVARAERIERRKSAFWPLSAVHYGRAFRRL